MTITTITFRLTLAEKARLEKLATLHNQSVSSYIKHKLFNVQESEQQSTAETGLQNQYTNTQTAITDLKTELIKYLTPILKTVMNTHGFFDDIYGDDITKEKREEIKKRVNDYVKKLEIEETLRFRPNDK